MLFSHFFACRSDLTLKPIMNASLDAANPTSVSVIPPTPDNKI